MKKRKNRKKDSLTPFLDKLDEVQKQFITTDEDIRDLENTRASSLDLYFLEVAEKHGLDLAGDAWGSYIRDERDDE